MMSVKTVTALQLSNLKTRMQLFAFSDVCCIVLVVFPTLESLYLKYAFIVFNIDFPTGCKTG